MADQDDAAAVLDSVLEALANPHRREIVYVLGLQPCAISQLARLRGLSLPAIHKHVKILENAGLVSRRKAGRTIGTSAICSVVSSTIRCPPCPRVHSTAVWSSCRPTPRLLLAG